MRRLRVHKGAHGQHPVEWAHEQLGDAPRYFARLREAVLHGDIEEHERVLQEAERRLWGMEIVLARSGRVRRQIRTLEIGDWVPPDFDPETLLVAAGQKYGDEKAAA